MMKSKNDQLNEMENLVKLALANPRDLRTLQIKFTYVGPQRKSLPSVVFTTFYHLVQMDWFIPQRRTDLSYQNDEVIVWQFVVTPEEIHKIIAFLVRLPIIKEHREADAPHLSLMLHLKDSRLGTFAAEIVLDQENAKIVLETIQNAIDITNGTGRIVINLLGELLFGQQEP